METKFSQQKQRNMETEFLEKVMRFSTYELKSGASTSYAFVSGCQMLPKTISIVRGCDFALVSRTGRGLLPKIGQMKAAFTKYEESPYKQNKPYKVNTSIWQVEGFRTMYYGTIGITAASGKIEGDNGDLVLFYTSDWKRVYVAIFVGLADPVRKPENLSCAAGFLHEWCRGKVIQSNGADNCQPLETKVHDRLHFSDQIPWQR